MIFGYKKNSKKVKVYNETTFRDHSILERQDLEIWLENYPEILGEDLLILTTEYDRFDKTNERLDLLAIDKTGKLVVIELKRDDSGKNVDLQALKYAAYCSTLTLEDITNLFLEYKASQDEKSNYEACQKEILNFIIQVASY
jgi:RecB family endonuclease NucS